MACKPVSSTLNGSERDGFVRDGENLFDMLRRGGDLSPGYGCGQGGCGAFTVLVDGAPVLACLMLAEAVAGRRVETAAGLAGATLHPLQEAFMAGFSARCGYGTPGMLTAASALIDRTPRPTREQVVEAIGGNLRRCTGYQPVIAAILAAAEGRVRA